MYAEGLSQVTARTILIFFHGLARVRPPSGNHQLAEGARRGLTLSVCCFDPTRQAPSDVGSQPPKGPAWRGSIE